MKRTGYLRRDRGGGGSPVLDEITTEAGESVGRNGAPDTILLRGVSPPAQPPPPEIKGRGVALGQSLGAFAICPAHSRGILRLL